MGILRIVCLTLGVLLTGVSVQARDWFFDKDSIGGACRDTGSGTISEPFCDVFNVLWNRLWNEPQGGDTIYIRQGTYGGRLFWIKAGVLDKGTASAPITIKAYPGEKVVFDGNAGTINDLLIKFSGSTNFAHDLRFIGPFEAKNYTTVLDGDLPTGFRTNLVFDGWTVHGGSAGFILRHVKNVTVRNSVFFDLKGFSSSIGDNIIGISVRGDLDHLSDNVLIENCVAHDINDGKGGDNGDADGFHTDQYVDRFTIRDSSAYRCSEDGMDTKARRVLLENVRTWDNGATGIKMWGGNIGIPSTYIVRRALTYGNRETGIKCTGWGDEASNQVTAVIDHLTAWGNGENGLKFSTATTSSAGCAVTVRNSIFGEQRDTAIAFYAPRLGYRATLNLSFDDLYHRGKLLPLLPVGCPPLADKYTADQYLAGLFTSDLAGGFACGSGYGTLVGTSTNPSVADPRLVSAQPAFEWASIAENAITGGSLLLVNEGSYPWPAPVVGHYIEIDGDGVKRRITAVGDATTRTIGFAPAVSSPVCGRATDCRGVKVTGWADGATYTGDMRLAPGSPAIDAGVVVSGVHCALGDDKGGATLTDCIHWSGVGPDLGFHESGLLPPPNNLRVLGYP